jgi:hypothetical protein
MHELSVRVEEDLGGVIEEHSIAAVGEEIADSIF